MLLLGGNSVGVAHARKTHRGKYGEATPWRQRGGGGSPPPLVNYSKCSEKPCPTRNDFRWEIFSLVGKSFTESKAQQDVLLLDDAVRLDITKEVLNHLLTGHSPPSSRFMFSSNFLRNKESAVGIFEEL